MGSGDPSLYTRHTPIGVLVAALVLAMSRAADLLDGFNDTAGAEDLAAFELELATIRALLGAVTWRVHDDDEHATRLNEAWERLIASVARALSVVRDDCVHERLSRVLLRAEFEDEQEFGDDLDDFLDDVLGD